MNPETAKIKLTDQLQELEAELKNLGIQNPLNKKDWIPTPAEPSDSESDLNDLGDRSEDWQERRGTLDVLETRYNNIQRALKKIETDAFGICELCKEPIESDRLEANPAARTCKTHINNEADLPL